RIESSHSLIVTGAADRKLRTWNLDGSLRWSVGTAGERPLYPSTYTASDGVPGNPQIENGQFDPSGHVLLTRGPERFELWSADSGEFLRAFTFREIAAVSRDYGLLAVRESDEHGKSVVRIRTTAEQKGLGSIAIPQAQRVEFSRDGSHLIAGGYD